MIQPPDARAGATHARPARPRWAGVIGGSALVLTLAGCATPTRDDDRALAREGAELFDPAGPSRSGPGAWSVLLLAFRGETRDADAAAALERVRTSAGLRDAFIEVRGPATLVLLGRHASPSDAGARADLARARAARLDGAPVFARAFLTPPDAERARGAASEYDLAGVKGSLGRDALYTLQVAVYSREDRSPTPAELEECRRQAEAAAATLRNEGELAFYYHGPTRSMVTVGVFGPNDFDPLAPGIESPAIADARRRFPQNLLNGAGVRERVPAYPAADPRGWKLQPSRLVAIP